MKNSMLMGIFVGIVITSTVVMGTVVISTMTTDAAPGPDVSQPSASDVKTMEDGLYRVRDTELGNVCYIVDERYGPRRSISCVNDLTVDSTQTDASWQSKDSDEVAEHNQ